MLIKIPNNNLQTWRIPREFNWFRNKYTRSSFNPNWLIKQYWNQIFFSYTELVYSCLCSRYFELTITIFEIQKYIWTSLAASRVLSIYYDRQKECDMWWQGKGVTEYLDLSWPSHNYHSLFTFIQSIPSLLWTQNLFQITTVALIVPPL